MPISALNRTDGDISIFFLAPNALVYGSPVTDPFFAATIPVDVQIEGVNDTSYLPDRVVSVMACLDQHQFCNPSNSKCTPLTGTSALSPTQGQYNNLDLNSAQHTTALLLAGAIQRLTTFSIVSSRGANALLASETVHDNTEQIGLPNTQWMTEVSNWFGVSMAKLQQLVVQYATGPAYLPEGYTIVGPGTKEEEDICNNQIIRSTVGFTSFSVLGVAIILIVGTLLIVTSLLIEKVMTCMRRMIAWNQYKSLHWDLDGTLQLQRLAYEEAGQGRWSGGVGSVPILLDNANIGLPRNADIAHPRLSQKVGTSSPQAPEEEGLMDQKNIGH